MVIFEDVVREEAGAFRTGTIAASVGPLARDGLDETFGFAVGLRAIGAGERVFEAEP